MTRAELDRLRQIETTKAHRRAMYRAAWKAEQDRGTKRRPGPIVDPSRARDIITEAQGDRA